MTAATRSKVRKLSEDPTYAAAWKRLQEIRADVTRLEREAQGNESGIGEKRDPLTERAEAYLADQGIAEVDVDGLRDRLGVIRSQLRIARAAEPLATQAVAEAESTASKAVWAEIEPEYGELVRDLAVKLIEAAVAQERLSGFKEAHRQNGVLWTGHLRPMAYAPIAGVDDRSHRLAYWLRDTVEFGLIDESDMPTIWRGAWQR